MPRKRSEALAAKARALASEGKTQAEVSALLGVPVRTLRTWGIDWPAGRPRVSDERASGRTRRRRRQETAMHHIGIADAGHYTWARLEPGQGSMVRCRRCGAWAHSADIPEGHAGHHGRPRFLLGEEGLCWQEVHECDPADAAWVAGRDVNDFGRLPSMTAAQKARLAAAPAGR